ncbi:MAG: hypothetical protein PHN19_05455 [Patescibacteria group bacterium]|nr:hypothetical protein [Patescibacteria group bacterium]
MITIFSGFNQRAVIAFLRTLEAHNLNYAIIASSENDSILKSKYKNKTICVRKSLALNLEDIINSLKIVNKNFKTSQRGIIAPSTEALNRFLLDNRKQIENIGFDVPLVNNNLYQKISNKKSFSEICQKHNILIPREINFRKASTPFVAKPKKYLSKNGNTISPVIIKNKKELTDFKQKYFVDDFYFQEYIGGQSLYLLYYFHRNGKIYKFSQENIMQQPEGKSIVAAITTTIHDNAESFKFEKLFQSLDFFGLVMIETKKQNNKYYMIEANPRFWGPSQLFVDAESNLFIPFLQDFKLLEEKEIVFKNKKTKYFWFGGISQTYKQNKKLFFHKNNEKLLIYHLPDWLSTDIYRREDTYKIFIDEIS